MIHRGSLLLFFLDLKLTYQTEQALDLTSMSQFLFAFQSALSPIPACEVNHSPFDLSGSPLSPLLYPWVVSPTSLNCLSLFFLLLNNLQKSVSFYRATADLDPFEFDAFFLQILLYKTMTWIACQTQSPEEGPMFIYLFVHLPISSVIHPAIGKQFHSGFI